MPEKGNVQSEGSSAAAAEEDNHANPSATVISEKGKSEKTGNT